MFLFTKKIHKNYCYLLNGLKKLSCWAPNKKGIYTVKKSYLKEWNDRLNILKTEIEFWANPQNISNKTIETIYLFFDKFENTKIV